MICDGAAFVGVACMQGDWCACLSGGYWGNSGAWDTAYVFRG